VLSGRGLCDEMITHPEESYRLWCVVVCDLENFKNEEAMTCVGSQRHRKKTPLIRTQMPMVGCGESRVMSMMLVAVSRTEEFLSPLPYRVRST
jgi:hypothetical protein